MFGGVDLGLVKGGGVELCALIILQLLVHFSHLHLCGFVGDVQFGSFFVIWVHPDTMTHLAGFAKSIAPQAVRFHMNTTM